ncbi:MAG: pyroglutamyl-peptidase I [Firmicutes bacterium]|nr:pyroglutamyl-peptidase I [Bacillota bacterium]
MILVTYFDPFGGHIANVSQEVATRLPRRDDVAIRELRTARRDVEKQLPQWIAEIEPNAILGLGQAQGRSVPTLERIGINLIDSQTPDNRQEIHRDDPIVFGGPSAYFSTLPLRRILDAVRHQGLPIDLSLSAGSFMCNQALYLMRHSAPDIPAGFLHLPLLPAQAAQTSHTPSMALNDQLTVVRITLDTITTWLRTRQYV